VIGKPYTRTGDIVIAVNPYQWLDQLYTEKVQMLYADKLVWNCGDKDGRKQLEPHVYETSALCYKGLAVDDMKQSILVSGESGAGKQVIEVSEIFSPSLTRENGNC
jgi:myosin heavy subunit